MNNKKSIFALLIVAVIGLVGITIAYFTNTTSIENEFKTKEYGSRTDEQFVSPDNWTPGTTTPKTLTVTNTGQIEEAVRISYSEKWELSDHTELSGWIDENGDLSAHTNNEATDERAAIINWANEADWTKDGNYYYYNYKLKPGETTSELLNSVTFNSKVNIDSNCETDTSQPGKKIVTCSSGGNSYGSATYTLTFNVETVQHDQYAAAWSNPNVDITLSKSDSTVIKGLPVNAAIAQYGNDTKGNLFVFPHNSTEQTPGMNDYRYIGDSPNNYVYFNCTDDSDTSTCEVWRIIGIFNVDDGTGNYEQRIKLIRGTDFADATYWNTVRNNNWPDASLKVYLNGTYYDSLSNTAQGMIDDARYYLGGSKVQNLNAEEMYKWERGTKVYTGHATYWDGKIALMYPSDQYLTYSNGIDNVCYNDPSGCVVFLYNSATGNYDIPKTNPGYPQTSWIHNSNVLEGTSNTVLNLLISPGSQYNVRVYCVHFTGDLAVGPADYGTGSNDYVVGARPVLYLSSDVQIKDGQGTELSPYTLEKVTA